MLSQIPTKPVTLSLTLNPKCFKCSSIFVPLSASPFMGLATSLNFHPCRFGTLKTLDSVNLSVIGLVLNLRPQDRYPVTFRANHKNPVLAKGTVATLLFAIPPMDAMRVVFSLGAIAVFHRTFHHTPPFGKVARIN